MGIDEKISQPLFILLNTCFFLKNLFGYTRIGKYTD